MSDFRFRATMTVDAACGIASLTGSSAWADSTISLNPGNIAVGGTAAAGYEQGCGVPAEHSTAGDFVSVTAQFDTNGDGTADTTKSISADGGGFVNGGRQAAKAYVALPAGWRLFGATAGGHLPTTGVAVTAIFIGGVSPAALGALTPMAVRCRRDLANIG